MQGIASDFAANALLAELPPGFNQLFEIHCCNQSGKFSTGSRDLSLLNREIAGTKPRATPLSSDDMVSINQLVDVIEEIAGVKLKRMYDLDAPKVVRGRNSDNTLIKKVLGWAPSITLRAGMEKTYRWIHDQVKARVEGRFFVAAYD